MVAKEQPPLAGRWYFRSLLQDLGDRLPVLQLQSHEHAGHEREMEGHVKFVAGAEIRTKIRRPLVGFRQQHAAGILLVHSQAQILDDGVRFRKIFAGFSFALDQIGNGIKTEAVGTDIQPELHQLPHGFPDRGIVIVQVRLMTKEPVPVVLLGDWIPGPVGHLRIQKNDARGSVRGIGFAPHVPVAFRIVARAARFLKPGMLVGSMVENHFHDHANIVLVSGG